MEVPGAYQNYLRSLWNDILPVENQRIGKFRKRLRQCRNHGVDVPLQELKDAFKSLCRRSSNANTVDELRKEFEDHARDIKRRLTLMKALNLKDKLQSLSDERVPEDDARAKRVLKDARNVFGPLIEVIAFLDRCRETLLKNEVSEERRREILQQVLSVVGRQDDFSPRNPINDCVRFIETIKPTLMQRNLDAIQDREYITRMLSIIRSLTGDNTSLNIAFCSGFVDDVLRQDRERIDGLSGIPVSPEEKLLHAIFDTKIEDSMRTEAILLCLERLFTPEFCSAVEEYCPEANLTVQRANEFASQNAVYFLDPRYGRKDLNIPRSTIRLVHESAPDATVTGAERMTVRFSSDQGKRRVETLRLEDLPGKKEVTFAGWTITRARNVLTAIPTDNAQPIGIERTRLLDLNRHPELYPTNFIPGRFEDIREIFQGTPPFLLCSARRSHSHLPEKKFHALLDDTASMLSPGGCVVTDGHYESYSRILRLARAENEFRVVMVMDATTHNPKHMLIQRRHPEKGFLTNAQLQEAFGDDAYFVEPDALRRRPDLVITDSVRRKVKKVIGPKHMDLFHRVHATLEMRTGERPKGARDQGKELGHFSMRRSLATAAMATAIDRNEIIEPHFLGLIIFRIRSRIEEMIQDEVRKQMNEKRSSANKRSTEQSTEETEAQEIESESEDTVASNVRANIVKIFGDTSLLTPDTILGKLGSSQKFNLLIRALREITGGKRRHDPRVTEFYERAVLSAFTTLVSSTAAKKQEKFAIYNMLAQTARNLCPIDPYAQGDIIDPQHLQKIERDALRAVLKAVSSKRGKAQ
jgi:hypothetical protein